MSSDALLPGFAAETIDTGEARIHLRRGGEGPPLVLLHGYPECNVAWHRVAPELKRHFHLVMPDLRGYGHSSCPADEAEHRAYSKRRMAGDVAFVMERLGFRRFRVMGHDRGARVGYRLALDRPELVSHLVVIDILTTWDQVHPGMETIGQRSLSWGFLAQPAPLPESLIGDDPRDWLETRFRRGTASSSLEAIDPRALAVYLERFQQPDRIHATCEDYRAGASADFAADGRDRAEGRRIDCPTLLIWGTKGPLTEFADPMIAWRQWCRRLEGAAVDAGHYIPEENPQALIAATLPFLIRREDRQ